MYIETVDLDSVVHDRAFKNTLEGLDTGASAHDMRNRLVTYSGTSSRLVTIRDGDTLVGVFGYGPVTKDITCYSQSLIEELGTDKITFPHNLYVRPEFRGRGISNTLRSEFEKDAKANGYVAHVDFKPKTAQVEQWMRSIPKNRELQSKDAFGGWLLARTL